MIDKLREDELLTALRNGPQTSQEIASRLGLGKGSSISSQILSLRDSGKVTVCATRKERQMILLVYKLTKRGEKASELARQHCPDLGACHHNCLRMECFRVHHASPLSHYGHKWKTDDMNSLFDPPSVERIFDA